MKLTDSVYSQIKEDVFLAKYKPNELITERQIAEKYGVSKLTAGEALHRLCADGHLTSYPRSGYMVTKLSPAEMGQLKRLRQAVESLVIEVVSAEASDADIRALYADISDDSQGDENGGARNARFHMALANLTNDKFIIETMETLIGSISRVEHYVAPEQRATWQDYHKQIIDALLARNTAAAKADIIKDISQM